MKWHFIQGLWRTAKLSQGLASPLWKIWTPFNLKKYGYIPGHRDKFCSLLVSDPMIISHCTQIHLYPFGRHFLKQNFNSGALPLYFKGVFFFIFEFAYLNLFSEAFWKLEANYILGLYFLHTPLNYRYIIHLIYYYMKVILKADSWKNIIHHIIHFFFLNYFTIFTTK